LLSRSPAISGHAANLAVSGAKMAAGPTQAGNLPSDVQYVTILLGANDLCTSSISTMTSTATFESQLWNTLVRVDEFCWVLTYGRQRLRAALTWARADFPWTERIVLVLAGRVR
jgi:hypothetical protein